MLRFILFTSLLALVGCVPPPEAPAELDELVSWLYSRHAEEDPSAMASGVDRLGDWLDGNLEAALQDDWEVTPLSEETVDSVDELDRSTEEMVALAVFTESPHTIEDAAFAMVGSEIDAVYPDSFSEYEREWATEPDCFLSNEC